MKRLIRAQSELKKTVSVSFQVDIPIDMENNSYRDIVKARVGLSNGVNVVVQDAFIPEIANQVETDELLESLQNKGS